MESTFAKNLKYLREKKNIGQLELAQMLGRKSRSSVSEWEKGLYEPKSGNLADIARIFGVSLSDLMNRDLTLPDNVREFDQTDEFIYIPVLGKISCGDPLFVEENYSGYRAEPKSLVPAGDMIYLQANGDSMSPTIPDGAHIMIRKQPDVENGEIAAVLVNGDTEATLKRVRKQGNRIMLVPDNATYDTIFVDEDYPARIIGKAVRITFDL